MDASALENCSRSPKVKKTIYRKRGFVVRGIIRWLIFIVIVVVLTGVVLKRWNVKPEEHSKTASVNSPDGGEDIEQTVRSFSIDGRSSEGMNKWNLTGESAEIKEDEIHLYNLIANVFGEKATGEITSDKGIYRKTDGEVELLGNVEVVSDDGTTLETDRAVWSQLKKVVDTDSLVRISRSGMIAVGTGGNANSDAKIAILKKDVTVTMEPATVVDCDGILRVDYNKNTAIFFDNVRIKDKEGMLFADKLTIFFDPETQEFVRGEAEGNVKIKKGKSYTMSEKAIFTESTKHAELLGRPRVIIDPEELAELEKQEDSEFNTGKF